MKHRPSIYLLALTTLSLSVGDLAALDGPTERRALRRASGNYGATNNGIPDGRFVGKVGNDYREHASARLSARSGRRKSRMVLKVWDGINHTTRLVRINARVRSGGRIVKLTGGKVSGRGLLPLGVQVRSGRIIGTAKLSESKERLKATLPMRGVDLTDSNKPVRGRPVFRGDK